jgi:hypothetical protein
LVHGALCCSYGYEPQPSKMSWSSHIIEALGEPILPMTSTQTLAGAMPAMQVDGPLMGDAAFAVLKKFA